MQRLKFTGHFLESMHKMAALGLYEPTDQQRVLLTGVADQLVLTVEALGQQGVFDQLDALKTAKPQVYLDIVGDSAHAVRGLKLALGQDAIRY